jgi:hypothetical protein
MDALIAWAYVHEGSPPFNLNQDLNCRAQPPDAPKHDADHFLVCDPDEPPTMLQVEHGTCGDEE